MRKLIIPLILLLLTSCTMIPEYKRPEAPIPREWPKGEAYSSLKYEELPKSTLLKWNDFLVDEKLQEIVKKSPFK